MSVGNTKRFARNVVGSANNRSEMSRIATGRITG
jgi:hypothetical protein